MNIFLNDKDIDGEAFFEANDDNDLNNIQKDDNLSDSDPAIASSDTIPSEPIKTNCICPPQIYMITKEQEFIFDIIEKIENTNSKLEYLKKFK